VDLRLRHGHLVGAVIRVDRPVTELKALTDAGGAWLTARQIAEVLSGTTPVTKGHSMSSTAKSTSR
jgi:hypothetical protein